MKKFLLTIASITVISQASYAADKPCCHSCKPKDKHSPIYLRLDLLGEKFKKTSMNRVTYKNQNNAYGVDFGLGYYMTQRLRAEAVYNHNFLVRFKSSNGSKDKAYARALFMRIMFDVVSFDSIKLFAGAGIGGARVSHKIVEKGASGKSGFKYNPAYSLHAGASIDLVEGVILDAGWSMRDYGKTSNITDIDGTKLKLRSQIVSLGLRFDV